MPCYFTLSVDNPVKLAFMQPLNISFSILLEIGGLIPSKLICTLCTSRGEGAWQQFFLASKDFIAFFCQRIYCHRVVVAAATSVTAMLGNYISDAINQVE